MTASGDRYLVRLQGGFEITDPFGARLAMTSRKGMALIAMLLQSPGFERQRGWIVDLLWGSRGPKQAHASLRQEVLVLKQVLNRHFTVFHSSRDRIWLDQSRIAAAPFDPTLNLEFLEGLEIAGESAFSDWLKQERQSARFRFYPSAEEPSRHVPAQARYTGSVILTPAANETTAPRISAEQVSAPRRKGLTIDIQTPASASEGVVVSDLALSVLRERMLVSLGDAGGISLIEAPPGGSILQGGAADLTLRLTSQRVGQLLHLLVEVRRNADGALVLVASRRLSTDPQRVHDLIDDLDAFANECLDRLLSRFSETSSQNDRELVASVTMDAVHSLFSRRHDAADLANQHLARSLDIEPTSAAWAWRAYLAALHLEEQPQSSAPLIREEAEEYCRRALELDANNGLALALVTQVHAFVLRDLPKAHEFLRRAKEMRPDHVMTQDAAALLAFYTGDLVQARAAAQRAEKFGAWLPFRYCFATTTGMIETMSGNFHAGVRQGERARALMPIGTRRAYPPTLRYLGVCYAQLGQVEKAREVFDELARLEGEVRSLDVDARAYPMPLQASAELLRSSLVIVGR